MRVPFPISVTSIVIRFNFTPRATLPYYPLPPMPYHRAKHKPTDLFAKRSRVMTAVLLILFLALAARLFALQVVGNKSARLLAEGQHSIYKKLLPSRGEIKVADRTTLETTAVATNLKAYLVYAVPQEIKDPEDQAEKLSKVINIEPQPLMEKMLNKDRKYVPLKRQLNDEEQAKIKELKLPGIYFDSEDTRVYPAKNLLSQVIGFVGYKTDKKEGLYGLERYFEAELAGQSGEMRAEKDNAGAWIFGTTREMVPAVDGITLLLTIDKTIQYKAEGALKESVIKHGADSGSVVAVDPKTGAILAMATYPDYDPNSYNKVENPKVYVNETTVGSYEPGSIFKALTMAAAINEGKVGPDTSYNDTGSVVVDGFTIKNSDNKSHGQQTMTQVLDESLNTGAIYAKEQIGNQKFLEYVKAFGFGQLTGVELPEQKGNLENLKGNITVNFHTASFGQGITVTPLQMAQAFTALANGGKMMKPYIVQSKIYPDGNTVNTQPKAAGDIISKKTADLISAMLVSVVENGHGKRARVPGYWIAGKTGTAQVARKDGKPGYEANNNIGSFIGYGPVEDPRFVMIVRINHPRDVSYAESTAAPVFGQLAQFILNYYQVPPSRPVGDKK